MPQLDVNAWPPQLFWLAVTFLVLYFIISKIVIPRTGDSEERFEIRLRAPRDSGGHY